MEESNRKNLTVEAIKDLSKSVRQLAGVLDGPAPDSRRWIPISEKEPPRRKLCDFLYPAEKEEEHVWIMCSCVVGETWVYGDYSHWRVAEQMPEGVSE